MNSILRSVRQTSPTSCAKSKLSSILRQKFLIKNNHILFAFSCLEISDAQANPVCRHVVHDWSVKTFTYKLSFIHHFQDMITYLFVKKKVSPKVIKLL